MGKFRQLLSTSFLLAILTTCALAQSNLTEIRDTIYNSNGTPFNGTVVITWVGFSTPTSGTVSPLSTSANIYNGALSVLLVPSTTAGTGSYYQVVYYSSDGTTSWTEQWSVPPSTSPLTVSAVRTSSSSGTGGSGSGSSGSGSSGGNYVTLPIPESDVTNLSSDLNTIDTSIASLTTNVTNLSSTLTGLSSTVSGLSSAVAALQSSASGSSGGQINIAFVDGESPAGTLNGANSVFTLSKTPTPTGSLELYRNGLVQTVGVDFTISGPTITFLPAAVPLTGDLLQAYYRVTGTSTMPAFADAEVPSGTVNGLNVNFTVAYAPNPALSLKLYKNGMLLEQNLDYTLSGTNVTFSSSSLPQTGDAVIAYYRH